MAIERNIMKIKDFLTGICKDLQSQKVTVVSENKKDIIISSDQFLNYEIIQFLRNNSPYPILTEEDTNQKNYIEFSDSFWILDPLDGSINYSRGIPISCISLALWQNKEPLIGIIYDFNSDQFYHGVTSLKFGFEKGAWKNGVPIRVSDTEMIGKAILCTGFPSWRDYSDESLISFVEKVKMWKKIRLLGSAAISLAWVASGHVDGYMEEDIRIWDVAAGAAIVMAAGGKCQIIPQDRDNFVSMTATNGKVSPL